MTLPLLISTALHSSCQSTASGAAEDGTSSEGGGELPAMGTVCSLCEELHEDAEHREFISAGASAGLSVRAPRCLVSA